MKINCKKFMKTFVYSILSLLCILKTIRFSANTNFIFTSSIVIYWYKRDAKVTHLLGYETLTANQLRN